MNSTPLSISITHSLSISSKKAIASLFDRKYKLRMDRKVRKRKLISRLSSWVLKMKTKLETVMAMLIQSLIFTKFPKFLKRAKATCTRSTRKRSFKFDF